MWLRDPSNGGFESLSHRYFRELNVTPQPPSRARTDAFENLRQRFLREHFESLNVAPQAPLLSRTQCDTSGNGSYEIISRASMWHLRHRYFRELNVTPQATVLTFTIMTFSVAEALEATENVAIKATESLLIVILIIFVVIIIVFVIFIVFVIILFIEFGRKSSGFHHFAFIVFLLVVITNPSVQSRQIEV